MHVAVSWDISASGDRWNAINERMKEGIRPYSWFKPLSAFYVVKINGEIDRQTIQSNLEKTAESMSEVVHFVISPIMSSSRYYGYLPKNMWEEINKRTD